MAEYCLRWNNHQPNLVTVFSELFNAEALVDVTLAADGHFIYAHKLVLSACSTYFKELFASKTCNHPIVFLKDIKIEDLKTVIDFIYRGEVNVSQERLQDVLKTAESLRIKGLADKPLNYDEYPSQRTGHHLSSSFSSQRSSLTDSRDQGGASVEGDDAATSPPPPTKKRKVVSSTSRESGDSNQDLNHEGDEKSAKDNDEECKVKEEKDSATSGVTASRTETGGAASRTESRAAETMLLLQGSSEGGDETGGTSLSVTPSLSAAQREATMSLAHAAAQGNRGPKRGLLQRQVADEESTPDYIVPELVGRASSHEYQLPLLVVPTGSGVGGNRSRRSDLARSHSEGVSTSSVSRIKVEESSPGGSTSMLIPMQFVPKQRSSPGSLPSVSGSPSVSTSGGAAASLHLRPIQPKPPDKDQPMIQFMVEEDRGSNEVYLPRAASEEPQVPRPMDLLSPLAPGLPHSLSQDAAIESGFAFVNRIGTTSGFALPKIGREKMASGASTGTPSSGHVPLLRDGPALGCNYCWNSQDPQGRTQRRKTKYHCPACRTNLCIVPCFHKYHSDISEQHDQSRQISRLTKTSTS